MLIELIYASVVGSNLGPESVESILEVSRRNNARDHVTGAQIFNSRYFMQWLEGDRLRVSQVYKRIAGDPRHNDAVILSCRNSDQRQFVQWSMQYMGEGLLNRELLLKYSTHDEFTPSEMTADSARAFIIEHAGMASPVIPAYMN